MPHVNVNLIYVGWENFTDDDKRLVNDVAAFARQVFWQVGFDLVGFLAYSISVADAQGYAYIDQEVEAEWLTSEWSLPGDGVDVFLVRGFAGPPAGLSPVNGPCNKNLTWPVMTGVVVELVGDATKTALPHEVGHYLGLGHDKVDPKNLMYKSVDAGGPVTLPLLTFGQGVKMAEHCFTRFP